jgi:hypothetical protein
MARSRRVERNLVKTGRVTITRRAILCATPRLPIWIASTGLTIEPGRTRGLREQPKLHEETDYAVILSLPVGFVHQSQYLRGYENYLMDLILNPEFVEALMDRTLDYWLKHRGDLGGGRALCGCGHVWRRCCIP